MKKVIILLFLVANIAISQENILSNSDFDDGKRGWIIYGHNSAVMTSKIKGDSLLSGKYYLSVNSLQGGDARTDVVVTQGGTVENGRIYSLSFMASASSEYTIQAVLAQSSGDRTKILEIDDIQLSVTPRAFGPYTINYRGEDRSHNLYFYLGGKDSIVVNLDAIELIETDDPSHFRVEEKFEKATHTYYNVALPFRLYKPDSHDKSKSYPLVLALHGGGERGSDNEKHIIEYRLATSWADSVNQRKYPCFVLAPQCPLNYTWYTMVPAVMDLLDSLITVCSIDTNRLYVTGLSMGGKGTWNIITRYPDKFAAAIPMSGAGNPSTVNKIKHIPIWNFHGEKDTIIPVEESRKMISALEQQGVECVYTHCHDGDCTGMLDEDIESAINSGARLLYTEWEGKDHIIWSESYDYPYLFPWVFGWNKTTGYTGVQSKTERVAPNNIIIHHNYPNPFNPGTTIKFNLSKKQFITLEIHNLLGETIEILVSENLGEGSHTYTWNAEDQPSGVYFYQLRGDQFAQSRKMLLVR